MAVEGLSRFKGGSRSSSRSGIWLLAAIELLKRGTYNKVLRPKRVEKEVKKT